MITITTKVAMIIASVTLSGISFILFLFWKKIRRSGRVPSPCS
jgi:hypothetical protein